MNDLVTIYTDGSSRGNPGPGGFGTVIKYVSDKEEVKTIRITNGYYNTTNNRMEVLAAIVGLEHLKGNCKVLIVSDSKYLVDTFKNRWVQSWVKNDWKNWRGVEVKNVDLWKRMLKAMEPHEVKFQWVRGHNGHPENELCDKLATESADNPTLNDDNYTK